MGGINIWRLLIIAVIVILLFGTRKLSSLGSDLGSAIKGFKKAMSDDKDVVPAAVADSKEMLEDKTTHAVSATEHSTSNGHQV